MSDESNTPLSDVPTVLPEPNSTSPLPLQDQCEMNNMDNRYPADDPKGEMDEYQTNIENLEMALDACETAIPYYQRCERWYMQFILRLFGKLSADEIKEYVSKIGDELNIMFNLNNEFNRYFRPIPYEHPWIQENEIQILSTILEIVRLIEILEKIHHIVAGKYMTLKPS